MRYAVIAAALAVGGSAAEAATNCNPNDNAARVLSAPSPNATHPKWGGESYIGTSWSLTTDGKLIRNETGEYRRGDLVSPRGGVAEKGVYVLSREWQCTP